MPKTKAALGAALGALVMSGALFPTTTRGQEIPSLPPIVNPDITRSTTTPSHPEASPSPSILDNVLPSLPADTQAGEVRAMWVVRDSLSSPERIRNVVALARKHRFNTLFVQVRGRGDAYYESRFEPRAEQLKDQPADFDPLKVMIEEAHAAGLQVHAWMNTFFVWSQKRKPYSSQHVVNRHPEWLVRDKKNAITWTDRPDCEGAFLDPANPDVRQYTRDVFLDVATRYAVDGIHFDYVRFPSDNYSFSDSSLARFREYLLPILSESQVRYADKKRADNRLAWYYCFPKEWRAWRQSLVTETVRSISQEAHRLRPEIIVSAAVFPNYSVATVSKGQEWREWLKQGFLDAACPMSYNTSTALVADQIRDAVANSSGKPIIAGIGAWQMNADSAIAKAKAFRGLGAAGINLFSYNGITREGQSEAYLSKIGAALFPNHVARPDWRTTVATARGDRPGGG